MVQRVTVSPSEVRGYGDIVSPKNLEDFTEYMCSVTESDGVYTMVYDDTATYLTLSASPTTITYGESTVLTATLTVEGEKASGETVYFYEGETLLGSDETDSNGEATLTKSDFSIGSHSVKAVYDEIESNAVSVSVNKLTSTITLSVPASGTVGTSYTVSGTLVPTSGSVKLYENGSLKDTLTVSSGTFSKVITQSNEGTYSYYAVFEGSSTYDSVTSSTGSIVVSDVPTPVPASITLTGTKSILSYADSESSVLTATVLDDNDDPVEGVSVDLYKDSVLWDTLTTGSAGTVSKTYTSAGVGDVGFTAECGSLVTESFVVQDIFLYDSSSSSNVSKYNVTKSISYDSTNQAYSIDSGTWLYRESFTDTDFICEADVKFTTKGNFYFGISNQKTANPYTDIMAVRYASAFGVWYKPLNGSGGVTTLNNSFNTNEWYTIRAKKQNGTLSAEWLQGDTVIASQSQSISDTSQTLNFTVLFENSVGYMKNIKLKLL